MGKRDIPLLTPEVFEPLLEPGKRYRGAHGGRASGKSHFFAEKMVEEALSSPGDRSGEGLRAVCVREVQRTLSASSKLLIEDKIRRLNIGSRFRIYEDRIKTPGDGLLIFQGMQSHTAESVKSLEGFRVAWIDEAQAISERSLNLLRPTIQRVAGAEIWASWNPRRPTDAIDLLLRGTEQPTGSVVVRANWRDNPFRSPETDQERADCLRIDPDSYPHIWEGEYATAHKGAYFTRELSDLRADGRLCAVPVDPLMTTHLFWDIGGTGAAADACSIWAVQRVGRTIGVVDYYEAVGQPLAAHVAWLHGKGYKPGANVQLWLPHDGVQHDKVYQVTYQTELEKAGYDVTVVKNQGAGAAMARVQAVRRLLPQCAIDQRCMPGVEALGWYHERRDENRNCGLGPEHDWCFAAGTEVMTPDGWVSINKLSAHNQVVTPCGNRNIIRSGIVRVTDKWVTTRGIRSTPEHRFFTKRGLVTAANLRLTDEFWTRGDWGLNILGLLCAGLSLGFMGAITSATQGELEEERPSSCIVWSMRLLKAKFRMALKCITSTITHSIITPTTLRLCQSSIIEGSISQIRVINACAESAVQYSGAIKSSVAGAAHNAKKPIMRESSASEEPAYSLTVDREECYFVRGDDEKAYLVANSSHAADSFGLASIVMIDALATGTPSGTPARQSQRRPANWRA